MIVVVDTNILFSAAISPNNKIAELLFSPIPQLQRISCYFAIAELFKHQSKIVTLSKLAPEKLNELIYAILRQVEFLNEDLILPKYWQEADRLTKDVDSKDISFVALCLQKDAWLWTGDKKLAAHLKTIGFKKVLSTQEIYQKLNY